MDVQNGIVNQPRDGRHGNTGTHRQQEDEKTVRIPLFSIKDIDYKDLTRKFKPIPSNPIKPINYKQLAQELNLTSLISATFNPITGAIPRKTHITRSD